ncbi:MAG: AmiS/UreI family transporter [Defluviitaleaceae bacterium]|nr:AmiS/UreI family transporter [Defluviitaleaceae bacterium]MCL2262399.1 AmiS/UreI family transporter [Defluviitaleaceae bacterium]
MLGIVLVMVGFVLFHNAWFGLFGEVKGEKAGATLSVVNFLGGAVILAAALYTLWQGEGHFTAMIYFMVGLTYIYIGFDHVYGLDPKAFGVFCLTGAIALFMGGVLTLEGGLETWREIWLLACWFSWAFLWFILFVECTFEKKFGKLTAFTCLATTFYTGWIPGFMMLAGWW